MMNSRFRCGLLVMILGVLCTSCDTTFEPMQENDQYHFSVYGYLDVAADTQWVRVTPVRDQLRPTGEPLDAVVTLENLSNGETIVMNDSLIQTLGETVPIVWTTKKIDPDTPYEMHVQGTEQRESQAEVHTPNEIPTPIVNISSAPGLHPHEFFADEIENLIDARALYCARERGASEHEFRIFSIPVKEYRELTVEGFPNRYRIELRGIEPYLAQQLSVPLAELRNTYEFFPRQVRVFASNEHWPDFISLDRFEQELPDGAVSNVEDGVGFLGSVASSTARFETCHDEHGDEVACEPEKPITSPLDCLDGGAFNPPN
ncbi:MAG: hypothetical protein WEA36_09230 [Balneolaceae bacterium]